MPTAQDLIAELIIVFISVIALKRFFKEIRCSTFVRQVGKAARERPDMFKGLHHLGSPEGADGGYESPPASELQRLMWIKKGGSSSHLDEVQPRIYIGDM